MSKNEILFGLEFGYTVETDDGRRYISVENMCGGKYGLNYVDENGFWEGMELTNDIDVAISFLNSWEENNIDDDDYDDYTPSADDYREWSNACCGIDYDAPWLR